MNQSIHFLVDASLPRAIAGVIASTGHLATDVRDIGLGTATDSAIAAHAQSNGLCLVTRDGDFGNVLDCPPEQFAGIVVLVPSEPASRDVVIRMVEEFLQQASLIPLLSGRLAVVEPGRVRLRPPV